MQRASPVDTNRLGKKSTQEDLAANLKVHGTRSHVTAQPPPTEASGVQRFKRPWTWSVPVSSTRTN